MKSKSPLPGFKPWRRGIFLALFQGEVQAKGGAGFSRGGYVDPTMVEEDNFFHNGQAQACRGDVGGKVLVQLVVAVPDIGEVFFLDAGSLVFDGNQDPVFF